MGTAFISPFYLADGTKIGVADGNNKGYMYAGSLTYGKSGGVLTPESIAFSGGRIIALANRPGTSFTAYYTITDHLGSPRVVFTDKSNVIARNDYYPFGMRHDNPTMPMGTDTDNRFLYNNKEKQTVGEVNLLDYGARMYDPEIMRWNKIDALAEKYFSVSPYAYVANNPVMFIDPKGDSIAVKLLEQGCDPTTLYWQEGADGVWGFCDADGNMFNEESGAVNADFIKKLITTLRGIMGGGPVGYNMIYDLAMAPQTVTVYAYRENGFRADNNIYWNPDGDPAIAGAGSQFEYMIATAAHEFAHAEQNFNGGLDATFWFEGTKDGKPITVTFGDVYASHRESMVRAENGFGIMDAYTQGSVYMPFASNGMSLYFDTSGNMHYDVIPDVNNRYTYKKRR